MKRNFRMNVKGGLFLMFVGVVLSANDWRYGVISFVTLVFSYFVRESMKEHPQKKPTSEGNR